MSMLMGGEGVGGGGWAAAGQTRSLDRRASTQLVTSAHSVACPLVLLNNVILLASCTSSYM